jgi:CO/xanthine dehydrogenase FAD-binding subunit
MFRPEDFAELTTPSAPLWNGTMFLVARTPLLCNEGNMQKSMGFDVITPRSVDDALGALASGERLVPLAGGTDLMVYLEAGTQPPCTFLNLQELSRLKPGLAISGASLTLGALTTYREVRRSNVCAQFPMLGSAAREIGALAIQSRGTWAGNIANASPAADGVPALMAYDADIELSSRKGSRRVPLSKFYRGYKQMDRRDDELITAIHLPLLQPGWADYYRKVGTRRFQAISKTLLAGRILIDANGVVQDVRMVFASVAPFTLRAVHTENLIRGRRLTSDLIEEAAAAIQDEIHPIDDIRSTENYRRRVTSNLVRDFLSRQR